MPTNDTKRLSAFISHGGPDAKFARWLADGLQKVGISSRLDQLEIRAGDNIVTWMNDAIGESDYLLLLLSPASVDRYWVKMEWSNALMKEADLRRTFVIPVILPGLKDSQMPSLLRAKAYLDFRQQPDQAFLQLVSRLKDDQLAARDLGRPPSPAPHILTDHITKHFPDDKDSIEVIVHSNRFGRSFRLHIPSDATPSYLMGMLRDTLSLGFSNVDEKLGVELSYTYYLRHKGEAITLSTSLREAGVKDGDRLELWIRVELRDLIEDKEIGSKVFLHLYRTQISDLTEDVRKARNRAFSSAEIARIASKFFAHVDEQ
jgi:hypothetical protein